VDSRTCIYRVRECEEQSVWTHVVPGARVYGLTNLYIQGS